MIYLIFFIATFETKDVVNIKSDFHSFLIYGYQSAYLRPIHPLAKSPNPTPTTCVLNPRAGPCSSTVRSTENPVSLIFIKAGTPGIAAHSSYENEHDPIGLCLLGLLQCRTTGQPSGAEAGSDRHCRDVLYRGSRRRGARAGQNSPIRATDSGAGWLHHALCCGLLGASGGRA